MALVMSAVAGSGVALADTPYRTMLLNATTDYGQAAYHSVLDTRVSWFSTIPVVLAPATISQAPDAVYVMPPPPMVREVTVYTDDVY